jgi:hypothetical protein
MGKICNQFTFVTTMKEISERLPGKNFTFHLLMKNLSTKTIDFATQR